jgi:hypothetical protein
VRRLGDGPVHRYVARNGWNAGIAHEFFRNGIYSIEHGYMNDRQRIARPMWTKLLAETARIFAACRIDRRVIDRRRVEVDFIPHQITIKSVGPGCAAAS